MKKKIMLIIVAVMACFIFAGCDRSEPVVKGVDKTLNIQCGTDFNLDEYLNENLKIKDETDDGMKKYSLKDLEYEIACDEKVYDAESGKVNTKEFGKFDVELTVKDESGNKAVKNFKLKLNPLEIEKGYYVYEDETEDSGLSLLGYGEITNTSGKLLKLNEINVQYFDKDGVMACGNDMPNFSQQYLAEGESAYVYDTFAHTDTIIEDESDIASIDISVKYSKGKKEDSTTLECSECEITNGYSYNVSGFAATTTVTNPFKRKVNAYALAGLYDKDGKLIGAMNSMDQPSIGKSGKARITLSWLPDSTSRPDKTVTVKARAYDLGTEWE